MASSAEMGRDAGASAAKAGASGQAFGERVAAARAGVSRLSPIYGPDGRALHRPLKWLLGGDAPENGHTLSGAATARFRTEETDDRPLGGARRIAPSDMTLGRPRSLPERVLERLGAEERISMRPAEALDARGRATTLHARAEEAKSAGRRSAAARLADERYARADRLEARASEWLSAAVGVAALGLAALLFLPPLLLALDDWALGGREATTAAPLAAITPAPAEASWRAERLTTPIEDASLLGAIDGGSALIGDRATGVTRRETVLLARSPSGVWRPTALREMGPSGAIPSDLHRQAATATPTGALIYGIGRDDGRPTLMQGALDLDDATLAWRPANDADAVLRAAAGLGDFGLYTVLSAATDDAGLSRALIVDVAAPTEIGRAVLLLWAPETGWTLAPISGAPSTVAWHDGAFVVAGGLEGALAFWRATPAAGGDWRMAPIPTPTEIAGARALLATLGGALYAFADAEGGRLLALGGAASDAWVDVPAFSGAANDALRQIGGPRLDRYAPRAMTAAGAQLHWLADDGADAYLVSYDPSAGVAEAWRRPDPAADLAAGPNGPFLIEQRAGSDGAPTLAISAPLFVDAAPVQAAAPVAAATDRRVEASLALRLGLLALLAFALHRAFAERTRFAREAELQRAHGDAIALTVAAGCDLEGVTTGDYDRLVAIHRAAS